MQKAAAVLILFLEFFGSASAQFNANYQPELQPKERMQYFTLTGENLYVGDCTPFFYNGTYYLYWLIDKGRHTSLNGLGGHPWVVSTTTDLKRWTHYPVVLGIDED